MATLSTLLAAAGCEQQGLQQQAQSRLSLWDNWLTPITADHPTGNDPGYDDDFQCMREEVNKLSGVDTGLVCQSAEKLLTEVCKDTRVATYYIWARLHRDGEAGLAEGLELLAALLTRYGDTLHPQRVNSRKLALEWLAGQRMLDSLLRYPEVTRPDFERIAGALALTEQCLSLWDESARPHFTALYRALENRLAQSGGLDAVVPQNSTPGSQPVAEQSTTPQLQAVQSGRELLEQSKLLAKYLSDQPQGWLSGHHLMKCVRWDTVHQLPPLDAAGRTRLIAPRADYRAQLKRLYLQQSWQELLEQADGMFIESVNHFWLDVQWYLYQALTKSPPPGDSWAEIIKQDLRLLLLRLPGLEGLAYSDGTPFADEVTQNWITQQVLDTPADWRNDPASAAVQTSEDDILQLEPEALTLADSEGTEAALNWLQQRPGMTTPRQQWLLRLLMARVAEQYGKNEMALHLLGELNERAGQLTLNQWEPGLLFEVKARRLKLLRMKSGRSEADKARLGPEMDGLLAGLIALDPARATVLCG